MAASQAAFLFDSGKNRDERDNSERSAFVRRYTLQNGFIYKEKGKRSGFWFLYGIERASF